MTGRRRPASTLLRLLLLGVAAAGHPVLAGAADDVERAKELVVTVTGRLEGAETSGAGIIVGSRADRLYIVTARHVVRRGAQAAGQLRVGLKTLPGESFEAALQIHEEPGLDLAVLRVSEVGRHQIPVGSLPFDRLGDPGSLRRGMNVFPVGNPKGLAWQTSVTPDRIRSDVAGDLIDFESSFIREGHSGGGLFTERGELVGMVVADQPPYGRALSIARIIRALQDWHYPVDLTRPAVRPLDPAAARPVPAPAPGGSTARPEERPGESLAARPAPGLEPQPGARTGKLCLDLEEADGDATLVASVRGQAGRRFTARPGECLDLEPGAYEVSLETAGALTCAPADAEVRAGATRPVRLRCEVDIAGRWYDGDDRDDYVDFRKAGGSSYEFILHSGGLPVARGIAVVERRVVQLQGLTLLGVGLIGELRARGRTLEGTIVSGGQATRGVLVR
jgi:hypothetical protein